MKTEIEYFQNGGLFVAVAAGQFSETVIFSQCKGARFPFMASVSFSTGSHIAPDYYYEIQNGYRYCSRETYLEARKKAQFATVEFFGEFEQFQAPVSVDLDLMQGYAVQVNKR